jgi:ubiquinone biosynthesis accessory factor UbiJ
MLTSISLPLFNRALRSNDSARQRLRAHAGKTARVECPPFAATVEVQPDGELRKSPDQHASHVPDVVVRVTPGVLMRLLARDPVVWNEIAIEGDSDLATALHQVWQQLEWEVEEDLSHLFGDIAAHRIAGAAKQARDTAAQMIGSALRNVLEYWTEERPVVVLRRDIESYSREVDHLRDDLARLEKRIEALQSSATSRFSAEYAHNNTTPPNSAGA